MRTRCILLLVLALATPLALIGIAITMAPWFRFWSNALSDLGHQVRHPYTARVFNTGLILGSLFSALLACKCLQGWREALVWLEGFSLALVAVFNEAYGALHFWVSVLFFTSLLAMIVAYLVSANQFVLRVYAGIALLVYAVIWYLHFAENTPPGASIPELISVSLYAPLLLHAVLVSGEK